jgi:hypothetical protein
MAIVGAITSVYCESLVPDAVVFVWVTRIAEPEKVLGED